MTNQQPPNQAQETPWENTPPPAVDFNAPGNPANQPGQQNALVSASAAGMQPGLESFPVLKSFQDFIEKERTQARRRTTLIASFFVIIIIVMITVFLGIGFFVFQYISDQTKRMGEDNKALQAALIASTQRQFSAPVPTIVIPEKLEPPPQDTYRIKDEVQEDVSARINAEVGEKVDKQMSEVTQVIDTKIGEQSRDISDMRKTMQQINTENKALHGKLESLTETLNATHEALQKTLSRPPDSSRATEPITVAAAPAVVPDVPTATYVERPKPARPMPKSSRNISIEITPEGADESVSWRMLIPE